MSRLKTAIAAAVSLTAMTTMAETIDCLTIDTTDGIKKFAISEIKEITFADGALTVVKTDGITSNFAPKWQIKFGETELSVGDAIAEASLDAPACVYSIDGRLVGIYRHLRDLCTETLAPGTYLIVSNGKTVKIQR